MFVSGQRWITRKDYDLLIQGYLMQKHRTPAYKKSIDAFDMRGIALREGMAMKIELAKAFGIDATEIVDNAIEQVTNDPGEPDRIHKIGMYEGSKGTNAAMNTVVGALRNMEISILQAPKDEYYFCSDNPGCTFVTMPDGTTRVFHMNFGDFQSVLYPFNSKQAIHLSRRHGANYMLVQRPIGYRTVTVEEIREHNRITTNQALKNVYCANRDYLKEFISAFVEVRTS